MPTLGSGWHSYRISVLRKFSIPTPKHGQDNSLFEDVANLAVKLLNEKLNGVDRASALSLIEEKVCELYGISPGKFYDLDSKP